MMSSTRIAIVGAGPVGLTIARLLLNRPNIEVVVFESDNSRHARGQGGNLDLHPDTGIAALWEAGLHDEFLERARYKQVLRWLKGLLSQQQIPYPNTIMTDKEKALRNTVSKVFPETNTLICYWHIIKNI